MTARYRCPWCGSFASSHAADVRKHILKVHRGTLIDLLALIESYGTRKEAIAPPRRLKDHLQSNMGVSGEGDS